MDKTIVGLIGAISGLAALDAAQAAPIANPNATGLVPAQSFAELLDPIPNAVAVLRAVDEETPNVQLVGSHHTTITTITARATTTTTIAAIKAFYDTVDRPRRRQVFGLHWVRSAPSVAFGLRVVLEPRPIRIFWRPWDGLTTDTNEGRRGGGWDGRGRAPWPTVPTELRGSGSSPGTH
jgi:hypothetical protein